METLARGNLYHINLFMHGLEPIYAIIQIYDVILSKSESAISPFCNKWSHALFLFAMGKDCQVSGGLKNTS